MDYYI